MRLEGEAWARYFQDFRSSAFRLELQQVYTMPGEADELRRFLAGEKPPADYHYGWLDIVARAVQAGKTIRRARIVRRPLTDYIRYQFEWGFVYNVAAGEDIGVLDLTDHPCPELPDHDFWLFDDITVVNMLYRPDGTQIARELVQDPDLPAFRRYRDQVWDRAVPFGEYRARLAPGV